MRVAVGDERQALELLHEPAERAVVGAHAALLGHRPVLLRVELAHHRRRHAGPLEVGPQLEAIAREAVIVLGLIHPGGGVQADAAVLLDDLAELIAHHELAGGILRLGELGLELGQLLGIRVIALEPLGLERREGGVLGSHRLQFLLVVLGADLGGALEGHVLEDVGDTRDTADLVRAAHAHVGAEREHRHVVTLEHQEGHPVLELELLDLVFQIDERLRGRRPGARQQNRRRQGGQDGALDLGHVASDDIPAHRGGLLTARWSRAPGIPARAAH